MLSSNNRTVIYFLQDEIVCWPTKLDLSLERIYFPDGTSGARWLEALQVNFLRVSIMQTNLRELSANVFNSNTFSQMTSLIIGDLVQLIPSNETFMGISRLESLKFKNIGSFVPIQLFNLTPLANFLVDLEMTNIEAYWSPISLLGNGHIYAKMKFINYSNNNFTSVTFNSTSFIGVKATIEQINLGNSRITDDRLGIDTFNGCEKLFSLNLNNNLLTTLSPVMFDGLKNLTWLFLQNNLFTTLPSGILSQYESSVFYLQLFNNPWFCDADISPVRRILENNNWTIRPNRSLTCKGPDELIGTRILDLWCSMNLCEISCKDTEEQNLMKILEAFDTVCIIIK